MLKILNTDFLVEDGKYDVLTHLKCLYFCSAGTDYLKLMFGVRYA